MAIGADQRKTPPVPLPRLDLCCLTGPGTMIVNRARYARSSLLLSLQVTAAPLGEIYVCTPTMSGTVMARCGVLKASDGGSPE